MRGCKKKWLGKGRREGTVVGFTQIGQEKGRKRNEKANRGQGWKREER